MQKRFDLNINKILEKPEIIFVILAFIFGCIFLFKTPPFEVPDEAHHLLRTCEIADFKFYNKTPVQNTKYDRFFTDIDKSENISENPNPNKYLLRREKNKFHAASRNFPIMYIGSSIGIKIGSLFTQDGNILFYLGRFLNLLVYILLATFAIKITPVFKYPFMYLALLPMALFEGMSYSADSFNNGFSFLFFAFIFKLIFDKTEINKKDFSILFLMSCIGAVCKGLIYPLGLLPFLPKFSKEFKYKKSVYISLLVIITVFVCYSWVSINSKNLNPDYFVINDIMYIFKEPIIVIKKFCITTYLESLNYARQMIGVLGWLHIYLRPEIYILGFISFLSLFVVLKEKISISFRIVAFLIFFMFYSLLQYSLLIYWSNPSSPIISGFQGRYLLSVMPLFFIVLSNNRFNFSKKFINIYKFLLILSIIYILMSACLEMNTFYNVYHLDRYLMDNYIKYGTFFINK